MKSVEATFSPLWSLAVWIKFYLSLGQSLAPLDLDLGVHMLNTNFSAISAVLGVSALDALIASSQNRFSQRSNVADQNAETPRTRRDRRENGKSTPYFYKVGGAESAESWRSRPETLESVTLLALNPGFARLDGLN
jgi:hypothetical protein